MTQSIRYCLQILSPVHIGCDEVYEPMAFFLDEASQTLCPFDPLRFIGGLNEDDRKELNVICRKGTIPSILELYKFIRAKGSPELAPHRVSVCSGLLENYHNTLSLPANDVRAIQQDLNKFAIQRTAFLPASQRPYIPGSAIKGALRTAYLNSRAQEKGRIRTSQGKDAARDLEKKLLDGGTFDTDPFRLLKVSDFHPVGEVKTRIIYAVNRKKQPSKLKGFEGQGPFQIMEVIQPGSVFQGWITVNNPPPLSGVAIPFTLEGLLVSAVCFFHGECGRENLDLERIGAAQVKMNVAKQGIPLRLGRHSGAECVTIQGYRDIKIKLGNKGSKQGNVATTLWLTGDSSKPKDNGGLKPFGWVFFKEVSGELWRKLDALEVDYRGRFPKATDRPDVSSDASASAPESAAEKHLPVSSQKSVEKVGAPAQRIPEPRRPSSKDLLSQAAGFRPNDKITLERMLRALDALEDQSAVPKIVEVIKNKLIQAGTWKKHPLKAEIESYLEE